MFNQHNLDAVVAFLEQNGPSTHKQVADAVGVTLSQATRYIRYLRMCAPKRVYIYRQAHNFNKGETMLVAAGDKPDAERKERARDYTLPAQARPCPVA